MYFCFFFFFFFLTNYSIFDHDSSGLHRFLLFKVIYLIEYKLSDVFEIFIGTFFMLLFLFHHRYQIIVIRRIGDDIVLIIKISER